MNNVYRNENSSLRATIRRQQIELESLHKERYSLKKELENKPQEIHIINPNNQKRYLFEKKEKSGLIFGIVILLTIVEYIAFTLGGLYIFKI